MRLVGRMRDGFSLEQTQAEADRVALQLEQEHPRTNEGWSLNLLPLQQEIVGPVKTPLLMLEAAVALVLLVVCANVAGIMLARAAGRRAEMAVRAALGAGAGRIAQLALTESVLVSVAGGVLGFGLAYVGLELFKASVDPRMPRLSEIAIDGSAIVFTGGVSILAGIAFGLVPARQTRRANLTDALRSAGRVSDSRERNRGRSMLVVAQVAVTLVLLVGAFLTAQSLAELRAVEPGYRGDGVVTAAVSLPRTDYPEERDWISFYDRLAERVGALPGVSLVGGVDRFPYSGANDTVVYPEGSPPERPEEQTHAQIRRATESYFQALGIPLVEGRLFSRADDARHAGTAIVSKLLAERFYGDESPVGQHLIVDVGELKTFSIVGVVGDVRDSNLRDPPWPTIYLAFRQEPVSFFRLAVDTDADPSATMSAIRTTVHELDDELPVAELTTVVAELSESTGTTRLQATVLGGFAVHCRSSRRNRTVRHSRRDGSQPASGNGSAYGYGRNTGTRGEARTRERHAARGLRPRHRFTTRVRCGAPLRGTAFRGRGGGSGDLSGGCRVSSGRRPRRHVHPRAPSHERAPIRRATRRVTGDARGGNLGVVTRGGAPRHWPRKVSIYFTAFSRESM